MLQRHTPTEWNSARKWAQGDYASMWRALSDMQPYKGSAAMLHSEALPTKLIQPIALIDFLSKTQSAITILEAAAEDGYICTLALLIKFKGLTLDTGGHVSKHGDPSVKCAIVHQMDRSPYHDNWYRERYKIA